MGGSPILMLSRSVPPFVVVAFMSLG